jgi:hypothetical protein
MGNTLLQALMLPLAGHCSTNAPHPAITIRKVCDRPNQPARFYKLHHQLELQLDLDGYMGS